MTLLSCALGLSVVLVTAAVVLTSWDEDRLRPGC